MKKIEIIPTVMPDDYDDFIEKINRVAHFVKTIQIDVMDGKYVPSKSWPYNSSEGLQNDSDWQNLINQEQGIPHWQDINFEIDLMVSDQIGAARDWISAGVSRVICHANALFDEKFSGFSKEEAVSEFFKLKKEFGVELYLALMPDSDLSVLDKFIGDGTNSENKIDGVQFMGINKIGYQGQQFEEKVLEKISILRKSNPDLPISVDGGVNFETAEMLIMAGVSKLSSGSLIFESSDPKETIESLENLASGI